MDSSTIPPSSAWTLAGGEIDPHDADLQGNPLGGVVYSNGASDSDSTDGSLTQVNNWNLSVYLFSSKKSNLNMNMMRRFVGSGQFSVCKICNNTFTSPDYCLNTYDLGCDYNMPSNVQNSSGTVTYRMWLVFTVSIVSVSVFSSSSFFGCVIL